MQPHASRSLCSLISFSPQFCHAHHLFLNYPYKGLLHNHPTRTSISSLLIFISLSDHYPFQASFGLFHYRNLLPSFNLSVMMPPRPSNLNCYKISQYGMLYTLHQRPHSDAFSAIYSFITFRDSSSAVFFPTISIYRFLHGNLSHILGQLLHGSIPSDYSSSRHLMLFRFLSLTQFPLHLILRDHLRPVLFTGSVGFGFTIVSLAHWLYLIAL